MVSEAFLTQLFGPPSKDAAGLSGIFLETAGLPPGEITKAQALAMIGTMVERANTSGRGVVFPGLVVAGVLGDFDFGISEADLTQLGLKITPPNQGGDPMFPG